MNILITAIGSFSADCVINSLKRENHRVIGCDIYPSDWHPVSKDCDRVFQVPFATDEEQYINTLLKICQEEYIDLLFPLTDLEIDILNKNRSQFREIGVLLCIQSDYCLSIARNKYEMAKLFSNDGIVLSPRTIRANDFVDEFRFPAIAKPYNGRSSEGLQRLMTKDDLLKLDSIDNYILQEMISGNVYTVDYVRDILGNDFSVPREELLRTKNGAGTTVRVLVDEKLQGIVSYIGTKLGIIGCVNMEFICHERNYYLIDINPRFSAGVAFSHCVGYDMVGGHLNAWLGRSIDKPISYKEQIIAKKYQEEILCVIA